jgi:hypothetical protein
MIKFFRRIRQQLLSKGKFRKYLIYAAGEIVLVVIGILIALQINDWNNYATDREKEKAILEEELNHQQLRYEFMGPVVAEYTDLSLPNNPESMIKNNTFFKSDRFRSLLFLLKGRLSPVMVDLEEGMVEKHINEIIRLTVQP